MSLLKDKLEERFNQVFKVCDNWMDAYGLELIEKDGMLYIMNLAYDEIDYIAPDILEVLDYIGGLIKMALDQAEEDAYNNMIKDYEIVTGYEYHPAY